MNQDGLVSLVVNHLQDGCHGFNGDGLLLGATHKDLTVLDVVGLHERRKGLRQVFVHEGAISVLGSQNFVNEELQKIT